MKVSKKKNDYVKQEPQNFSINPFFSQELRTFDDSDDKIESPKSPKAFSFQPEKSYPGSMKIVHERSTLKITETNSKLLASDANEQPM
jgi:hypothetical protein